MYMPKIIILKGLPASGKSTKAREMCTKNGWKRVSKDDLRAMLDNSIYSGKNEGFVLRIRDNIIRESLSEGWNIIVDDTNLNSIHIEKIQGIAKEFKAEVEIDDSFLSVPPEECIRRDLIRPNSVGSDVIWKMYYQYLRPEPVYQDPELPLCVLIDLDGTVAKMNGRRPFDWDKVDTDLPIQPIIDLVRVFNQNHREYTMPAGGKTIKVEIPNPLKAKVIFMSGRDGSCYQKTLRWLMDNGLFDFSSELFMRAEGDQRKDSVVKKELWENHVKDKYFVKYVVDDRPQVVRLWKNLGFTVLNVGDGYEF